MGDSLWCHNWTDSTVISIDNISSGRKHEITWSTGETSLDITFRPNDHMAHFNESHEGENVRAGQVLGLMGRTSNLACRRERITHTHIVVYDGNYLNNCDRLNPLDYFASVYDEATNTWTYDDCED